MSQVRNANITFEIERDQREKPTLLCGIEIFPLPIILVEIKKFAIDKKTSK